VRLISATHHDVEGRVREGTFRSDLYYRIGAHPLRVPPLRERREDIGPLATGIVHRLATDLGRPHTALSPDANEALAGYDWPGNIRELRNVLERALLVARGSTIDTGALAIDRVAPATSGPEEFPIDLPLEELERRHIERVLRHHGGRVDRAAVTLGISRSTLYSRIKGFQLEQRDPA